MRIHQSYLKNISGSHFLISVSSSLMLEPSEIIFHSAMVDTSGEQTSDSSLKSFNRLASKNLAIVYFSEHWFNHVIHFPADHTKACKANQAVPFIRMCPWTDWDDGGNFTHSKIAAGEWFLHFYANVRNTTHSVRL